MSQATHPLTFIHPACKRPAVHCAGVPHAKDAVRPEHFEHLDGRPVLGTDVRACESCGGPLGKDDLLAMCDRANYQERTAA